MSHLRTHSRLLLIAVCCAAAGAGASVIAGAGAATTASTASHAARAKQHGLRRLAARTVHGSFVVHTKAGFRTVTIDRGVVDSVTGDQLKLTEGTPKASYKTVTLTIPADARIRDDKHTVSLAAVKAGERVLILTAPQRTLVVAHSPRAR